MKVEFISLVSEGGIYFTGKWRWNLLSFSYGWKNGSSKEDSFYAQDPNPAESDSARCVTKNFVIQKQKTSMLIIVVVIVKSVD